MGWSGTHVCHFFNREGDYLCGGRPKGQGAPAPHQIPNPGSQSWEKKSLWEVRNRGCENQCRLGLSNTEAAEVLAVPLKGLHHKLNFQGPTSSELQHQGKALGNTDTYEEELLGSFLPVRGAHIDRGSYAGTITG
uniref:Uncharacterized protein n=1 Tax=Pipistrellus kuhlii TaxID=59472 RepID=A0A7J8B1K1_PIPKU|nr:hypothetical protein mPipKuh1_007872 [Pipistrellus kuhlii]